ncbi:hypothetical protein HALLA_13270 [Halostagnicola larsenii XH-48]|uniref:Uncharacterized protein n=1 Tax=Halostagnicola larsenii XH-48 TaxID=797299 RepID=W0JUL0_9EURY|nr:hypothetical protein HALLA_13270 [Halostagnicola larsenii XH-48]
MPLLLFAPFEPNRDFTDLDTDVNVTVDVSPIPRMTPAQRSIPADVATSSVWARSSKLWKSTISRKYRGEVSML